MSFICSVPQQENMTLKHLIYHCDMDYRLFFCNVTGNWIYHCDMDYRLFLCNVTGNWLTHSEREREMVGFYPASLWFFCDLYNYIFFSCESSINFHINQASVFLIFFLEFLDLQYIAAHVRAQNFWISSWCTLGVRGGNIRSPGAIALLSEERWNEAHAESRSFHLWSQFSEESS